MHVIAFASRREVDLNGKNIGGWTPLMYASYIGHDNIANLLLEAGVDVNATTAKGVTPLMLAASCGNESIAYFLLQVQSKRDKTVTWRLTVTASSMFYEHPVLIQTSAAFPFLCASTQKQGAELELKDCRGWTALFHCTSTGHQQMVKFLLENNADANVK